MLSVCSPICPQIRNTRLETRLYGLPREIIPEREVLEENEFDCLNLTVTVPAPSCRAKHDLLPVMVWIHGGGNVTGCATDWIWDAGALVRRSMLIEKPVIIVSVKCVNPLAFTDLLLFCSNFTSAPLLHAFEPYSVLTKSFDALVLRVTLYPPMHCIPRFLPCLSSLESELLTGFHILPFWTLASDSDCSDLARVNF